MLAQTQVKRVLRSHLTEVRSVLAAGAASSRTAVADRLCERFGLADALGRSQRSSCLKALRGLEREGHFARLAEQWRKPAPEGLGDYMMLTARLGGYPGRNGDGPPGTEILWRGLTTLGHMCMGFVLFQRE